MGKTVKMSSEWKKTCWKLDRILIILENGPAVPSSAPFLASSASFLGLFSMISKHVYWYIQQTSGECLQDHWPSDSCIFTLTSTLFSSPDPVAYSGQLNLGQRSFLKTKSQVSVLRTFVQWSFEVKE